MNFFLDTNTCVYFLKGTHPAITSKMRAASPSTIKIPSIVKAELLFGAAKSKRPRRTADAVHQFLAPFAVVPFEESAAHAYARIRADLETRGLPIGANDLIVAATVQAHRGTLVTHNVREFGRVPGMLLEDWTE